MKKITAYYLRQNMYTLVPDHLREDLKWMTECGTSDVAIAVLEGDLFSARANLDIIRNETHRCNMNLWVIPSRWGGLVAGAPKVPSLFASSRPHLWSRREDQTPYTSLGPCLSIHYNETLDFFYNSLRELLVGHNISGIIWDEPKTLDTEDFSRAAQSSRPAGAGREWDLKKHAEFFSLLGKMAKEFQPDIKLSMFLMGHMRKEIIDECAAIKNLDEFGCDGRPWSLNHDYFPVPKTGETVLKALLDQAPAFISAARKNGKKTFALVENHSMETELFELMDKRLPDVLKLDLDRIMYYYFPRNVAEPERQMKILKKHLKQFRR
ncbi:MAG TPA: hypothetical protein DC049_05155 [Spirochaetia bacterium]|nr:hypothetical protein [Spirochaetia bacterium]